MRKASREDLERELKRFDAEFDKLKDTTWADKRARELHQLSRHCGAMMEGHVKHVLKRYPRLNLDEVFKS
jgi:hypothetical protein